MESNKTALHLLTIIMAGAGALAFTVPAQAKPPVHCTTLNKAQVIQLFNRWNNSLLTLDPDKVAANYADDAVLLPTVSNQARSNRAEIHNYFEHFLQSNPVGKVDQRWIETGCNIAIDTGLYTFTLMSGQNLIIVPARYTYVYTYRDGKWLITNHHSSAMPELVSNSAGHS